MSDLWLLAGHQRGARSVEGWEDVQLFGLAGRKEVAHLASAVLLAMHITNQPQLRGVLHLRPLRSSSMQFSAGGMHLTAVKAQLLDNVWENRGYICRGRISCQIPLCIGGRRRRGGGAVWLRLRVVFLASPKGSCSRSRDARAPSPRGCCAG